MSMIYKFNINHDPIVRGSSGSQIQPVKNLTGMEKLYDFLIYENNFYSNVGSEIPFEFDLEAKLKPSANLTDVLHQGQINAPFGIVISNKFKNFLSDFNIIPCRTYEMKIRDINNELVNEEYYWMYPIRLVNEIDFAKTSSESNSVIQYIDENGFIDLRRQHNSLLSEVERKFPLNNPEKQLAIKSIQVSTSPQKIFLKEEIAFKDFDFFGFKYDQNWYISEKLKNALEESNLTGFEIGEMTENEVIVFD